MPAVENWGRLVLQGCRRVRALRLEQLLPAEAPPEEHRPRETAVERWVRLQERQAHLEGFRADAVVEAVERCL